MSGQLEAAVTSRRRVGAITIGQSPRVDVTPDLLPLLGAGVELVQQGALDLLSPEEIAALRPGPADAVVVSRLRDGTQAVMRREAILPLIQAAFDRLAGQVDLTLMLCTGTFPRFRSPHPVLYPEQLLFRVIGGFLEGGVDHFGVITPVQEQVAEQRLRWQHATGCEPEVVACSPYVLEEQESRLAKAALQLRERGTELIVMDCLGFSMAMKRVVTEASGLPVVLARGLLGRLAAELLDRGA